MATIAKTASGTWKALVRKQGWPQTIRTFRLKADAQDWARRVEDEMTRGVYVRRAAPERLTLALALDRYLATVTPTKRPGSQATERTSAAVLCEHMGGYALAAITPAQVAEYRDRRLSSTGRRGRLISANTVRLELALLGHLYTVAIKEWGLGLPMNPVAMIRRPSPGPGRNRRLVGDEEARLLGAADSHSNPMLGWIVRLALATGMRHGEIVSLTAGQVDLDRRVVRLTMTKNGSARTVPLSTAALAVLREALACPLREGSPLLFPGEPGRGGVRRPYVIGRTWQAAVHAAGLDDFRFHDLRHEAVSRLVERGLSDQEVSAVSGHKSMQMLRRYTHLRAEDLADRLG